MGEVNPYYVVIGFSLAIIVSYLFNIISKKTNIPSVLLLIVTGILVQQGFDFMGVKTLNLFPILEILGIVGLIMIVLEAALDLELKKEKWPIIWKSFVVAFLGLAGSMFFISLLINAFLATDYQIALLYAIPLSIISSAIVIPSVTSLDEFKHEFMVYESTFSDILGIMAFYFLLGDMEATGESNFFATVSLNVVVTILVSFVASYLLILLFQQIKTKTKLFLLISVLILLYDLAKLMHLSSLLIILVFGLILNNHKLFFAGFLEKYIKDDAIKDNLMNFKLITLETAFVVRTFFFLIFGMTISLKSLLNFEVFVVSSLILLFIFMSRFFSLRAIVGKKVKILTLIAPRGLITILLFFSIPVAFQQDAFDPGILLYVIILSSLLMTYALIDDKKQKLKLEAQQDKEEIELDSVNPEISKQINEILREDDSDNAEETKD